MLQYWDYCTILHMGHISPKAKLTQLKSSKLVQSSSNVFRSFPLLKIATKIHFPLFIQFVHLYHRWTGGGDNPPGRPFFMQCANFELIYCCPLSPQETYPTPNYDLHPLSSLICSPPRLLLYPDELYCAPSSPSVRAALVLDYAAAALCLAVAAALGYRAAAVASYFCRRRSRWRCVYCKRYRDEISQEVAQ